VHCTGFAGHGKAMNTEPLEYAISHAPVAWTPVLWIAAILTVASITSGVWLKIASSDELYDVRELIVRVGILVAFTVIALNFVIGLFAWLVLR